ncbi:MAG: hypothetical protein HUU14_10865 [Dehalococcoidia bacterium]|nr:hypothetical protein [Dehalococcoidia bacterium]MCL4230681.1 hypothetical protein [Dehalococcoidia bacterium]NUQ56376.1 hypothetical protein [Dehalococcoidia bacterium]
MWPVLAFLAVLLAAGVFRGIAAIRAWWLDRGVNPAFPAARARRARVPSRPAPCGKTLRHLLLRTFGSEEDCRLCAELEPREPLPFARKSDHGSGPAGSGSP